VGCARCLPACPVDAIIGARNFTHTVIHDECVGCGLCLAPCPVDCIALEPRFAAPPPDAEEQAMRQNRLRRLGRTAQQRFRARKARLDALGQRAESRISGAPPATATARVAALRQTLGEARAQAILEPSAANVTAYLQLQRAALDRAATFSDAFRRTVWASPALDYTLRRPVGALAKHLWADARRAERAQVLAQLGERYGLIYLGDAACAACRIFGPLLRAFATRHGLDVLAVSRNGGPLDGWPAAVPDAGRSTALGLAGAPRPALVLYDTQTRRVQPVAFGVIAEDQLAERLLVLTAREVGHDY